jgi:hypothetical protein
MDALGESLRHQGERVAAELAQPRRLIRDGRYSGITRYVDRLRKAGMPKE